MKARPRLQRLMLLTAGTVLLALPASAALKNRYSFGDAPGSTNVVDSVSGKNGVLRVATVQGGAGGIVPTLDGSKVTLDGVGGYVDLPNGLISGLTNLTFEFWFTWDTGGTWTRLLDFGTRNNGEDANGTQGSGTGQRYFFVATTAGAGPRAAITFNSNGNENQINSGTNSLSLHTPYFLAVTWGPERTPGMFINGSSVGTGTWDAQHALSVLTDVNDWLGRSQWGDPFFGGSIDEFRIYDNMLGQLQILADNAAGPNVLNPTPENPTSITLNVKSNLTVGVSQDATVTGVFPTYGTVTLGGSEVTMTSSDTNVVSVGVGNTLTAVGVGTAQITASLGGQNSSATITTIAPVAFTTIKHRYSFNGTPGDTAVDSITSAGNGFVIHALSGPDVVISNGVANFPYGNANSQTNCGYISLPSGLISTEFTNITVEMWFTWNNNNQLWQRVFDFGDSNKGTDPHVTGQNGRDFIMFTPARSGNGYRAGFQSTDGAVFPAQNADGPAVATPTNVEHHVVAEYASALSYLALYVDGFLLQVKPTPAITSGTNLALLNDKNMWLGVSQYNDPAFGGKINELRLWEGILNEVDVAVSRKAGPDATLPLAAPGALQSISLQPIKPLHIGDATTLPVTLLGDFANVTGLDITGFKGVSMQSSNTSVFTVTVPGNAVPTVAGVSNGTASLVATYQTFSSTTSVQVLAPTSISVTNLPLTVDLGSGNVTVPLFANFADGSNNVNVTAFAGVTRSSSDTNIATITGAGVITIRTNGTTTITSTYGGQTNQALLTVLAPTSLIYTNLPATRESGGPNFTVALFGIFPDNKTNNVTTAAGVVHSSSNTNVATISGGGVVTLRNPGTTTIMSSWANLSVQATLTVQNPPGFVPGTLIHRYSFSEAKDTTTVADSVGSANGTVVNEQTTLDNGNFTGTGQFMFGPGPSQWPPQTNAYINLPNGLVSGLTNVTLEGWFTRFANTANMRFFDFGMSSGSLVADGTGTNYNEDAVANPGRRYMFFDPNGMRFALDPDTGNAQTAETPSITSSISTSVSNVIHFAVVYEFTRGVTRLYVNGQRAGTGVATFPLSVVDDRNDWLGRSQWQDPFFDGQIDEFRIYNGAFLDSQILLSYQAGPNALPVFPPNQPTLSFSVAGNQLTLSWPTNSGSFTLKSSAVLGTGASWTAVPGVTVVGQNNQVTVPTSPGNAYYRLEN